jgi:hypothetical protein
MRTVGLVMVAVLLVGAASGVGYAQNVKKARKTLNQVKLVDGAGSGLDADTVQGFTPDQLRGTPGPQGPAGPPGPASANANTLNGLTAQQIIAQANGQIAAVLLTTLTTQYFRIVTDTLPVGFCGCRQTSCNPGDFAVSCNGAVSENGTGYLTQIDQSAPIQCEACGCAFPGFTTAISVGALCLDL